MNNIDLEAFKKVRISDYDYSLPEERIAKFPKRERDSSKLLRYSDGIISEAHFYDLPRLLPSNSLIVVNDTKVIRARLIYQRATGARVEIFCLEPVEPVLYEQALNTHAECVWHCLIGNSKKWKGEPLSIEVPDGGVFSAERVDITKGYVKFFWNTNKTFGEMLELLGELPIPPYLKRETDESDIINYQTTYARQEGSVAAPTAGLHFTNEVLNRIHERGIEVKKVTLHVGAGTFLPVKGETMGAHDMHSELIQVPRETIKALIEHKKASKPLVSVGTTSTRTLESLYYMGCHKLMGLPHPYMVSQWEPYQELPRDITLLEALEALSDDVVMGKTQLLIEPGFRFRMVDHLITNFHQPHSTLLLLIAAFIGSDWRKVYEYALNHDFRFLSYGDSSFLDRSTHD